MTTTLLAIIKAEDRNHFLVKKFLESPVTAETEIVLDSDGHVGTLQKYLRSSKNRRRRRFLLIRIEEPEALNTEYFAQNPGAALVEIPDRLKLKLRFKEANTLGMQGGSMIYSWQGSIDYMILMYEDLAEMNPKELLADELVRSNYKRFTKKRLFGLGKTRIVSTYVSVGLETADGKYLLETTGSRGPFGGILPD